MDAQRDLVMEAQASKAPIAEQGYIDFIEGNATDVDLFRRLATDRQVWCVTCFTTLHWLKQPAHAQELAVLNFARALAVGGQLLVVHFLGLDDAFMQVESEVAQAFPGVRQQGLGDHYIPVFGGVPYEERLAYFHCLFEAAGLTVEKARLAEDRFPIGSTEFPRFLQEASRHMGKVPEAMHDAYLKRWSEEIIARGKAVNTGSSIELGTRAIVAVLRKDQDIPEGFYDLLVRNCYQGGPLLEEVLPRLVRDRQARKEEGLRRAMAA